MKFIVNSRVTYFEATKVTKTSFTYILIDKTCTYMIDIERMLM